MNLTDYQIGKIDERLQREDDTAGYTFSEIYSQSSQWGYWLIVTNEKNEKLEVHVNLEVSARINGGALYILLTDVNEL